MQGVGPAITLLALQEVHIRGPVFNASEAKFPMVVCMTLVRKWPKKTLYENSFWKITYRSTILCLNTLKYK